MRVALHFEEREILGVVAARRRGRWVASRQARVAIAETGLRVAVNEILSALGFDLASKSPEVWAVLPRSVGVERAFDIPRLRGETLLGVVAHELEAHLPWPVDSVMHGFVVNGRRPGRLNVLAVAVPRDAVEPIIDAIRESGAQIAGVTLSDLALLGLEKGPCHAGGALVLAPVGTARSEAEVVCLEAGVFRFSRRVALNEPGGLGEELAKSARFARENLGFEVGSVVIACGDEETEGVGTSDGPRAWDGVRTSDLGGRQFSCWAPEDAGALPSPYWPALGALQPARVPNLLRVRRDLPGWAPPVAAALTTLMLLSGCLWGYVAFQERAVAGLKARLNELEGPRTETSHIAGEVTALESEIKVWRRHESLAKRLNALEAVAASVPGGTEFTGLTISGERIVDLPGRAPSAVAVVEALQQSGNLSCIALAGPVRTVDGAEEFHVGGGLRR